MKDRVPLYPGRVILNPVSGQENTYDLIEADQPLQEGTPLTKANLLSDPTAAAIASATGIANSDNPVINEMLANIAAVIGTNLKLTKTGSYVGTGTKGQSNAVQLAIGFCPVFVAVLAAGSGRQGLIIYDKTSDTFCSKTYNWSDHLTVQYADGVLSYYTTNLGSAAVSYQLNDASINYYWVAIGEGMS